MTAKARLLLLRIMAPRSSILVGAVGADADDVLQDELVRRLRPRMVVLVLQAEAAELAGGIVDHRAVAPRRRRQIVERGAGEAGTQRGGMHLVVAQSKAPLRHELVDALGVEAGLGRAREIHAVERALLLPQEELALQLEVALDEIAVGRPFEDAVGDVSVVGAGEDVGDTRARAVDIVGGAVLRGGMEVGQADAVAEAVADIVPGMDKPAPGADAVVVVIVAAGGKRRAAK